MSLDSLILAAITFACFALSWAAITVTRTAERKFREAEAQMMCPWECAGCKEAEQKEEEDKA